MSGKRLTVLQERKLEAEKRQVENKSRSHASDEALTDTALREAAVSAPKQMGLPVQFRDGHSGRSAGAQRARVERVSAQDIRNYASAPRNVCGTCRFFHLKRGQEAIVKQKFLDRLVREEGWQTKHIGAPPDHLGLCGQSNGELAVTTVSPGCDGWRDRKGRL